MDELDITAAESKATYLKHHVKMAFPSVLAFKNLPEEIEYEITSKHVPDVTKGKISLISEKN